MKKEAIKVAKCKYCQKEITWVKEGRKNVPLEHDGGVHRCVERENAMKSYKRLEVNNVSSDEIAKYEQAINKKIRNENKKQSK